MYSHHTTRHTHAATSRPTATPPLASADRLRAVQPGQAGSIGNQLLDAVRCQDRQAVTRLVQREPDSVRHRDRHGNTALHLAIVPGCDPAIVDLLLANGADPAATNGDGDTCLHLAFALRPPVPALPAMLMQRRWLGDTRGLGVLDMRNAEGQTALDVARDGGRIAAGYEHAVAAAKDEFVAWKTSIIDSLKAVVQVDNPVEVRNLVRSTGWRLDQPVCDDNDLLTYAQREYAVKTVVEVIRLAGEQGCLGLLNRTDVTGQLTPLIIAMGDKDAVVANALIDGGADVNGPNASGIVPLHMAAMGGDAAMVRLLLSRGARVEATDEGRITPLMVAANGGHEEIVRMLHAAGGNINARDADGVTPLMMAYGAGHLGLGPKLVAMGANPDAVDNNGVTVRDYIKLGREVRRQTGGQSTCAIL